jgi:glycosyltransferase involved in cell wall biosynthesis
MDASTLHVVQIGFFWDLEERLPSQLLRDWWPLVDTAEMVARTGARVTVIQACIRDESLVHGAVTYHFVARDVAAPTLAGASRFVELIARLRPDVFHVHGLCFPAEIMALSRSVPDTPILVQDHANGVPRFWRRRLHRRALSRVAGVAFCALDQAQPFRRAGLLEPHTAVFDIPECSSRFTPGEQQGARDLTGLRGDPVVLWVGHLDSNKDPLTLLAGVAAATDWLPNVQLYCCFGKAPLRREVERCIARDLRLEGRVHLLGKVPHERIEVLMRAADMFVLGSHHEGSGCSVIEALACGLPTAVTSIPSFRALTGEGRAGALWSCDQAADLCRALLSLANGPGRPTRCEVRAHFERELSFQAVGRKLLLAYEELILRGAHGLKSPPLEQPATPVMG